MDGSDGFPAWRTLRGECSRLSVLSPSHTYFLYGSVFHNLQLNLEVKLLLQLVQNKWLFIIIITALGLSGQHFWEVVFGYKTLSLNVLKTETSKSLSMSVLNTKPNWSNYSFFCLSVNLYLYCYKLNQLFLSNHWCTQGPAVLPPHLNHFTHLMVVLSCFPGFLFSVLLV